MHTLSIFFAATNQMPDRSIERGKDQMPPPLHRSGISTENQSNTVTSLVATAQSFDHYFSFPREVNCMHQRWTMIQIDQPRREGRSPFQEQKE